MIKHLTNEKGFTLIEILVVIGIIAILSSVGVASYSSMIHRSEESACQINREQIEAIFLRYQVDYPGATLQGCLAGHYSELNSELEMCTCPDGGTYYVGDDGNLKCTVHGGNEEAAEEANSNVPTPTPEPTPSGGNGGGGTPVTATPSDDNSSATVEPSVTPSQTMASTPTTEPSVQFTTMPNTNLRAYENYWPQSQNYSGGKTAQGGDVFEYEDEYYVVTEDIELTISQAASGPGNCGNFIQKLTGTIRDYSGGVTRIKNVDKGDICEINGQYMMYISTAKWAYHPDSNSDQWFAITNN